MILEAKYTGPFPRVTVPGFQHRTAVKGEVVKIRIAEGKPIGGCWEIVKGKKEYEAGLKVAKDKLEAEAKAKAEKIKARNEAELKKLDKIIEDADKPKPVKKGAKP